MDHWVFAWDLFQFFLFSKSGTGVMPKSNKINYKQCQKKRLPGDYKNPTFKHLLSCTYLGETGHWALKIVPKATTSWASAHLTSKKKLKMYQRWEGLTLTSPVFNSFDISFSFHSICPPCKEKHPDRSLCWSPAHWRTHPWPSLGLRTLPWVYGKGLLTHAGLSHSTVLENFLFKALSGLNLAPFRLIRALQPDLRIALNGCRALHELEFCEGSFKQEILPFQATHFYLG